jgi:glycosyltransferase involved in cell wall biosynthesis
MKLGGFVIHGNDAGTLDSCVRSLLATCDTVVAVDSESTDGSAELVRGLGVRSVSQRWRGYGAARARAVRELDGCDYVFFLDSDEHLREDARGAILAWKRSAPSLPHYRLPRRDLAHLDGRTFLFRTESHVRLVRRDAATWIDSMIVHESLPRRASGRVDASIEHLFTSDLASLAEKLDRYALLWAIRAHGEGRRPKSALLRGPAMFLRNAAWKGGMFRGGLAGARLATAVARYHEVKHRLLADISLGACCREVAAFREGRFEDLFAMVRGASAPVAARPTSRLAAVRSASGG